MHQAGFIMLQWWSYWMLNNFFIENLIKSKLKVIGEFGCTLDIVESHQWLRFNEGDIEFWAFSVIENSIKLQNMILEGKFSWVTNSHLG